MLKLIAATLNWLHACNYIEVLRDKLILDIIIEQRSSQCQNMICVLFLEIPHFLTESECDHLVSLASSKGLQESETRLDPNSFTQNVRVLDMDQDKRLSVSEVYVFISHFM